LKDALLLGMAEELKRESSGVRGMVSARII